MSRNRTNSLLFRSFVMILSGWAAADAVAIGPGAILTFSIDYGPAIPTSHVSTPFVDTDRAYNAATLAVFFLGPLTGTRISVEVVNDPSIAYNLELTNTTNEAQPYLSTLLFPINALGTNTISGELLIELLDANGDGQASLTGNIGTAGAIQEVTVGTTSIGPRLGSSITTPGTHSFVLNPMSGPTPAGTDLFLRNRFTLSPGDSAHITSRFIIDEGTGIPFAEIPPLPDPADGPFFNVINVNSPETSLGDNAFIGSQTQLNVSEGGSIGDRFNFDALMKNRLNDENFDVEVNITGGTVGTLFQALSGTTVNIAGGTVEGSFVAGSERGSSTDVEVNISGGEVGKFGNTHAYAGSVVNISGGLLAPLEASGGIIYIAGGTMGIGFSPGRLLGSYDGTFNISGGAFSQKDSIQLIQESAANISGGLLTTAEHQFQAGEDTTVNLFGTAFLLDGAPIEGLAWGVPLAITDRGATLSGVLTDGSPFSIDLNPASPGDFVHPDATLTVTLALAGDYNNNGTVDAADYASWRNNLGSENVLPNDTSPGMVTQHDYELWRANFGKTRPGIGASTENAIVPEPESLLLLLMAVMVSRCAVPARGTRRF